MTGIALEIAVFSFGSSLVDSAFLKSNKIFGVILHRQVYIFLVELFPDNFDSFVYSAFWFLSFS